MINVEKLSFSYRNMDILKDIAFDVKESQCTAILGNNGAGKSTLIKCLNNILKPKNGRVFVDGKNTGELKRNDIAKCMAYVAQKSSGDRFTVFDSVLLGRKPYIKLEPKPEDLEITEDVINRLGLHKFSLRYVDELSGGEMQKVMLARALAQKPRVLLLDEPTSNLDLGNQYEVLSVIHKIVKEEKISAIIVIHDLNLALRYCDKFLFVKNNMIYAYEGRKVVTSESISNVYGVDAAIETVHGIQIVVPLPQF